MNEGTDRSSTAVGGAGRLGPVAAVLVLAGFAIDFAGGRWGAYIPSPVPNVYLADLLWAVGCVLAAAAGVQRRPPRRIVIAAVACVAYAAVRAVASPASVDASTVLVLRDLAPFGYLALVPLAAVALSFVRLRAMVWLLRIGAVCMLVGYAIGLLPWLLRAMSLPLDPGGYPLAGFPGRYDVLGLAFGIGVVAWGRFEGTARPRRAVQVVLAVAAMATFGSQISQIAAAMAIGWAVWRERRTPAVRSPRAAGLVLLATVVVVSALPVVSARIVTTATTPEAISPMRVPAKDAYAVSGVPDSLGTLIGRAKTYVAVLDDLASAPVLAVGRGIGDPSTLLEVCGIDPAEYQADPHKNKCPVDSGESATALRDPHNWALNLTLYHGLVGAGLFVAALVAYWWRPVDEPVFSITAVPVALYFVIASVGVFMSASFGLLPVATFTAFALSRGLAVTGR